MIDEKKLIEGIETIFFGFVVDDNLSIREKLLEYINSQPTAFDVDKVVEHLIKHFDFCQEMAEKNDKAKLEKLAFSWRQVANGVMDAIYIVKGAVKDD